MASKLLDDRRIHELHAATIEAGLADRRAALMASLDAAFVASLPVSPSPSVQVLTDLHGLNLTLGDGSVPIERWLKNAFVLAGPRAAGAVFEAALVELCVPLPPRPPAPARENESERENASASASAPRGLAERTDVVILAAVQDELEAVLALGDEGRRGWEERRDLQGFPYFRRAFAREDGGALVIAAAWIGAMGQDVDTALRGQQLVAELAPACLAMCGICGGWRRKVALGDIVVADQLYVYDHGKLIAGEGPESGFYHHVEGYGPGRVWKMDAAFFARAFALDALARERPRGLAGQRAWLLRALHAHESEGAAPPDKHPDRKALCPAWRQIVPALRESGLIAITGARLHLTDAGRAAAEEELLINLDGPPSEPPLRVHVGAMATGRTVRQDPTLFERLARIERATIAVDMEGAAVAKVAAWFDKRSLVVKAVSDHADDDKDDRFRAFACQASATFLLAFLLKHQSGGGEPPGAARKPRSGRAGEDAEGLALLLDERGQVQRGPGFVDRVEQICRLRQPGALFLRHATPHPFVGAIEMIVPRTPVTHRELLVALEQAVSEDALAVLAREILPARRRDGSLACKLVHLAPTAPATLALRASRLDVELVTFDAYQGLVDFGRYKVWLARRLENDHEYPRWLYVEQPASVSLAGQAPERTPSALASLRDLLDRPERRFALILGDFGAGKSFLLRELARSLLDDTGALVPVPVLVEMRYLEKTLSLRSLLAQHFGAADAGSVDIDAFLYMLREGRVVLLFDGFDELAVRVTYDQVLQHFATITGAVEGRAKVIVSSRRQHFLDDGQVKLELARSAEQLQGYRLVELHRFEEPQIRRFLRNRLADAAEADARYRLIHDVKDLLGLSHNPRMLSFIADLERERLEAARESAGEITPARLYEVLIERWLDGECARTQVKKASLWSAVRSFARRLWATPGNAVDLASLPRDLVPRLEGLKQSLSEEEARLVLGSRSLLKRDAEGMFSFVHRSVLEWLVAGEAVREVEETGSAAVLDAEVMSPLMARFFVNLAGREAAETWARREFESGKGERAEKNALSVAAELKLALAVSLEGRDLRGVNLGGLNLRGANLRGVNLEGVALGGRDLSGADLTGARLARVDLRGAKLTDVDLTGADLTFAHLSRADLTGVTLKDARMLGADLLQMARLARDDRSRARNAGAVTARQPVASWGLAARASVCWAVAYHPGGHLLATGHHDSTVRLWDAVTGQLLSVLEGHSAVVRCVAFSPCGRELASGSDDKTIRMWDVAKCKPLSVLEGHTDWVRSVAWSADGMLFASGSEDNTLRVWEAITGLGMRVLKGHTDWVRSVAFSPDSQRIASGSEDTTIRLWDALTGQSLGVLEGHTECVRSVAWSPDGRQIASASEDNAIRLWDADSRLTRLVLEGHTQWVRSVAWSPDGQQLASASEDMTLCLWDASSGRKLSALSGHTDHILSVAWSPDGSSLASGAKDRTTRIWDVTSGHALRTLAGPTAAVESMAISPDGRSLASGNKSVCLWDLSSGKSLRTLDLPVASVKSVAFSPDGQSLAVGDADGLVYLWDVNAGQFQSVWRDNGGSVWSVAFSPNGRTIASASEDRKVRLRDVTSGQVLRTLSSHTHRVWDVAFSSDGQTIASCAEDGKILLWDATLKWRPSMLAASTESVWSVAFSPDGRTLASGSEDKLVRLGDVASGRLLHTFMGHRGPVWSVAFSPNGQWIASGSEDQTIQLWSAASGKLLAVLSGHSAGVRSVVFSPDSRSLASGSTDGTIRLWDVTSSRCLAVLFSAPEGWVAFVPEEHPGGPPRGAFKLGGDIAGSFWHRIGLARFEPGELDELLPEGKKLRLPDEHAFLPR